MTQPLLPLSEQDASYLSSASVGAALAERLARVRYGNQQTVRRADRPCVTRLTAAFGIKPGDPLYADRIIERELELRVALGESGYPFAELDEPELLIDHARTEGDLSLLVQPGGKFVFGKVVSGDPGFLSGRHLSRIARFDEGNVFQQSLETDLRRAIIATGLVSSVAITPRETRAPQGSNGFGFDPIMFIPEFGKTFAQLPVEVKNANSHRGRAAQAMLALMRERWLDSAAS